MSKKDGNMIQLSVRLEPAIMYSLDELTKKHRYWKRNTILNRLLKVVLSQFDDADVDEMLLTNLYKHEKITAIYKREKL